MKGIELSHSFFREVVSPILQDRFTDCVGAVSAAVMGEGSDVLGYDDLISRDHNFTPRVALLLDDEVYDRIGETMAAQLRRALPEVCAGIRLLWTDYATALLVLPLRRHFMDYLGVPSIPLSTTDWLRCDEQRLLELTAGPVFHDPSGQLAGIRRDLAFYPPGVRLYLLRVCFSRMSEAAGVERSIRRGDWIATRHYASYFTHFAIRAAHLLAGRFCPYHKWMARSLRELGSKEAGLCDRIDLMAGASGLPLIRETMLAIVLDLGTRTTAELAVPPPRVFSPDGLTLLAFEWDAILEPLSRHMPEELRSLSPLISPPSYIGAIFDYRGHDGTYRDLLETNLGLFSPPGQEPHVMNPRDGVSIEIRPRPTGRVADGIMSIVSELTGEWFTEDVAEATRRDLLFHDVVCGWHEGHVRSFIMFTSHDGILHIALMGTSPAYRGRGFGSALLEHLVTHAENLGFGEIVAFTVPPTSRPAYGATVRFYQKHGFRVVQEHSELWQSGAWELRRRLREPEGA